MGSATRGTQFETEAAIGHAPAQFRLIRIHHFGVASSCKLGFGPEVWGVGFTTAATGTFGQVVVASG